MSKHIKASKKVIFLSDFENEFARRSAIMINTFTSYNAEVFSLKDLTKIPQNKIWNFIRECKCLVICSNKVFDRYWQTFLVNRPYIQVFEKHLPGQMTIAAKSEHVLKVTPNKSLENQCLYIPMIPTDLFPYTDDPESLVFYHHQNLSIWKDIID